MLQARVLREHASATRLAKLSLRNNALQLYSRGGVDAASAIGELQSQSHSSATFKVLAYGCMQMAASTPRAPSAELQS